MPLRRVSKKRAVENREYAKVRAVYLLEHPLCAGCKLRGQRQYTATQIHHVKGRTGRLLIDSRHFMGLCEDCHSFVHASPRRARELGMLANASDFGRSA